MKTCTQLDPEFDLSEFDPLGLCGPDISNRHHRRASLAAKRPSEAIRLKCIECCGWEYPRAKRCHITTCALWALSRRYFNPTRVREAAQASAAASKVTGEE